MRQRAEEFVFQAIPLPLRLAIQLNPIQREANAARKVLDEIPPEPANRPTAAAPNESAAVSCPCATSGRMATLPMPSCWHWNGIAWSGEASRKVARVADDQQSFCSNHAGNQESSGSEPEVAAARLVRRGTRAGSR